MGRKVKVMKKNAHGSTRSNDYKSMKDDVEAAKQKGGKNSLSKPLEKKDTPIFLSYHPKKYANEKLIVDEKPFINALSKDEEEEVYLVRQKWAYCTITFSVAQIVIMAVMMLQCGIAPLRVNPMIGPYPDALSYWGGKNSVLILEDDEWWRLMSPILLHAGVIHLLCNVAVQLEIGSFFEKEWGSFHWLIIYLTSALLSSVMSVIFMPDAISVGSSGAVMGLFGGKLAEIVMRSSETVETNEERIGMDVRKEQCTSVTCSVIVVMLFSFIPFVDWAAHAGGVIGGFVVGLILFSFDIKGSRLTRAIWLIIGIAATFITYGFSITYMYSGAVDPANDLKDVCGYYKMYFEDFECSECTKD